MQDEPKIQYENILLPLFDTQTIEANKKIERNFFVSPNLDKYKSNMTCNGCLPYPQKFKLSGISISILNDISQKDKKILEKSYAELRIACKPYVQIPLKLILFNNLSIENLNKIYSTFKEYRNKPIEELEKKLPDLYPDLYLFFPVKLENDFIIIQSQQSFCVEIESKDEISKDCEIICALHGYLMRPIL